MKFVPLSFKKAPTAKGEVDEISKLVRQRLEHVEMIFELRHYFRDTSRVQHVGENGWTHPWRYFDALMYYLLLTCFDLLGQPGEWVSFSEWLQSKKKADEREVACSSIPSGASPIAITQHFNASYQKIYGMKQSFHNFVFDRLTDEEREELYKNVQIVRAQKREGPNTSYRIVGHIDDDNRKLEFMLGLRNKFTHSAVIMGSPNAGVFDVAYTAIRRNGNLLKGYVAIHRTEKENERLIYQVRDWPFVLHRLIVAVLVRRERELQCSKV